MKPTYREKNLLDLFGGFRSTLNKDWKTSVVSFFCDGTKYALVHTFAVSKRPRGANPTILTFFFGFVSTTQWARWVH